MLNVTIASLTATGILRAPLLCIPSLSSSSVFFCVNSQFARFGFPALFTLNSKARIHIQDSAFSNFISRALFFSNLFHKSNTHFSQALRITDQTAEIEFCRFEHIASSGNENGGAIFCAGSLSIFCCFFSNCRGSMGGAIASTGVVQVDRTTAIGCKGQEGGVIDVRTTFRQDMAVMTSLFVTNSAHQFGTIYRLSPGLFRIWSTNITSSYAQGCVGAVEMKQGDVDLRWMILSNSSSGFANGGICIRELRSLIVESCIFTHCGHDTSEYDSAAVFLLYDTPFEATICESAFLHNRRGETYLITVASGNHLLLRDCCFTGPEATEIHQKNYESENCIFEQEDCRPVLLGSMAIAGYDDQMTEKTEKPIKKYIRALKEEQWPNSPKPLQKSDSTRRSSAIFAISASVAAMAAGSLGLLQIWLRRCCGRGMKMPRDVQ
jgi:hypothetical protein